MTKPLVGFFSNSHSQVQSHLHPLFWVISFSLISRMWHSAAVALSTSSTPSTRILCYGDSLTAGTTPSDMACHPYAPHLESALEAKGKTTMVRYRGNPGMAAFQMVEEANGSSTGLRPAIKAGMPIHLVVVLAGTNDLAYPNDASSIAESIIALHKLCHEENVPHTVAVGIPPSGYQSMCAEAADAAQSVNTMLKDYCASEPRATFLPFPFQFAKDDERWSIDGLHLSPEGYRVLGLSLAPLVDQILHAME